MYKRYVFNMKFFGKSKQFFIRQKFSNLSEKPQDNIQKLFFLNILLSVLLIYVLIIITAFGEKKILFIFASHSLLLDEVTYYVKNIV